MTKVVFNIIALVLFATPAFAQVGTEDLEVTSLRGLQGVRVLVEQLRPELKRDGLTEDQLQTDAEIRLRKAGIPVLTEATLLNSLAKPFLYIQVQAFSPIADSYIFSTTVQLEQEVTLIRFLPQQRHRVIAPT